MTTSTGEQTASPDRLDVLATEVGVEVEQELEREGFLGRARSGAAALATVPVWTKAKVGELVDAGLDRIYAKPLDITTADEAVAFLTELREESASNESTRRIAGILATAGPILTRLARGTGAVAMLARTGTKVIPTGRMFAIGTTAVLASVRIGASARVGTRELQILASYLVRRLEAAGLPVDRDLLEQVVVQVYLDPDARPLLQPGVHHGFGRLTKMWTARGIRAPGAAKQATLNRKRAVAIERLDVAALVGDWRRAQAAVPAALPVAPTG